MKPCAGDWVEVRSKEEILSTLDRDGRLDGLPFMPQMFEYCGRRFPVYKRASKTCDTVSGRYVGLSLADAVHLELRCDGHAYGGCQAGCLIFWKTAWLKPADAPNRAPAPPSGQRPAARGLESAAHCTEDDVRRAIRRHDAGSEIVYSCQATELLAYTAPLKWWDARQYVECYASGNQSLGQLLRGLFYLTYYYGTLSFSARWGRPARWLYNRFQAATGGVPFPRREGRMRTGLTAPRCDLGLKPGDLVRVKSYEAILATLDANLSNRGLNFNEELVPYCGKVYRVKAYVENFVDEKTGKPRRLRTPAVILEGVTCRALYSGKRMFCPRGVYLWWREIWLERFCEPMDEPKLVPNANSARFRKALFGRFAPAPFVETRPNR